MISEQRASLAGGVGVWGQGSPGVPGQAGEQCPRAAESEAEAQRAGELRGVLTTNCLRRFLPGSRAIRGRVAMIHFYDFGNVGVTLLSDHVRGIP